MPVYLLFLQVGKNNLQLALRPASEASRFGATWFMSCERGESTSELRRETGGNFLAIRPQKVNFGNRIRKHQYITQI